MNKVEFLRQLEAGLGSAAPDERVAAIQYYTEYLDEAGPEREAEVLEELGSPKSLAADILGTGDGFSPPARGAAGGPELTLNPGPAVTWQAYTAEPTPPPAGPQAAPPPPYGQPLGGEAPHAPEPPPVYGQPPYPATGGYPPQTPAYRNNDNTALKIILVVAFVLCIGPITGLLASLFGVIVAAVVIPFALGAALTAGGIVTIVAGSLVAATSVGTGLVAIGVGVMLVGLGLLALYGGATLVGKVLPRFVRWAIASIKTIWRKIFPKKEY